MDMARTPGENEVAIGEFPFTGSTSPRALATDPVQYFVVIDPPVETLTEAFISAEGLGYVEPPGLRLSERIQCEGDFMDRFFNASGVRGTVKIVEYDSGAGRAREALILKMSPL